MTVPRFWREQPQRYRLVGTTCRACSRVFFPPRSVCPDCRRESVGKVDAFQFKGVGKVATWTVVHSAAPGFANQVPYVMALIDLEEGARIMAQLVDVEPEAVSAGLPVRMCFRKIREDGRGGIIYYGYKFGPVEG